MTNKPLLFTIAAIIGLISLVAGPLLGTGAPSSTTETEVTDKTATEAPADAAVEPDVPAKASMEEQLVGTWVQAARGGEDGRTSCGDAEIMTTLNGGTTDSIEFYRNGKANYTLWYDTAFESHGEPQVKAAYNSGTWAIEGTHLNEHWTGGTTGLFGSDLGAGDDQVEISIDGNVMTQSTKEGTTRFVRCL